MIIIDLFITYKI